MATGRTSTTSKTSWVMEIAVKCVACAQRTRLRSKLSQKKHQLNFLLKSIQLFCNLVCKKLVTLIAIETRKTEYTSAHDTRLLSFKLWMALSASCQGLGQKERLHLPKLQIIVSRPKTWRLWNNVKRNVFWKLYSALESSINKYKIKLRLLFVIL